jgi:histidinol-phosphate/aromatic aminotransferase/cobyric acid decarboxylase-like protein
MSYAAPTFVMAEITGRMNGLDTRSLPWADVLAEPGLLLEGNPDVVYLCTPNNPTGAALEPQWVRRFLDRVGAEGPLVILDEAYADYQGQTLIPLALEHGRTVVTRTLSKLYALAGVRVGYGVAAPEVIREVEKSRGPFKLSAPAERAAVAALRDESGWAQDILSRTRRNRDRLVAALASRGVNPHPSVTNFLLVPVAPLSTDRLTRELAGRGIAVRPFPAQPDLGDCVRVTVGPWAMMETFLAAFDEVRAG